MEGSPEAQFVLEGLGEHLVGPELFIEIRGWRLAPSVRMAQATACTAEVGRCLVCLVDLQCTFADEMSLVAFQRLSLPGIFFFVVGLFDFFLVQDAQGYNTILILY